MDPDLCLRAGIWYFSDPCVRALWGAIAPVALFALIALRHVPLPKGVVANIWISIKSPFQTFITLEEAEALDGPEEELTHYSADAGEHGHAPAPLWRAVLLSWIALIEALVWLSIGTYRLITDSRVLWYALYPVAVAGTWLYAFARPVFHPTLTQPYDLFALFLCQMGSAVLLLGGVLYDQAVLVETPLDPLTMVGLCANLSAVTVLLVVVLRMPLDTPSKRICQEDIGRTLSPEDYTSLWSWITFSWIRPILILGSSTTLREDDVWMMSPTIKSRPIFIKFRNTLDALQNVAPSRLLPVGKSYRLLRTLLGTNSRDLLMDFILTLFTSLVRFSSPFYLKRILDAIEHPSRESYAQAYIYASLTFFFGLLAAEFELQHLWFGRRAITRIRSELMAAIFDKSLKRKDYSGIVDKEKEAAVKDARRDKTISASASTSTVNLNTSLLNSSKAIDKRSNAKSNNPKAGADVGKIVNLMSTDANEVADIVAWTYNAYGAPLEIAVGGVFLYQLLGWSAFAGGVIPLAAWPLNSWFSRQRITIHKGLSTARDERMAVLNEFIGSIKFIKFFAWDDRWIARTLDARDGELKWLAKARMNSILFDILWMSVPVLVLILSFFAFVVQGNELTIPIAFTAIALFGMIQRPLNVLPMFFVDLLQAKVALDRIATYLEEDEVSEQVSTLKKDGLRPLESPNEVGLGIRSGSFRWNEVPEEDSKAIATSNVDTTATDISTSCTDDAAPRFELKDINVMFPEGRLTVVTGPTASGKTALLMALLGELTALPGTCLIMSKETSRIDSHGHMHAISYAAQLPWLRFQSIKDNVLFGQPFDEARYLEVVDCCALNPDLQALEDGDATEIGARGITLSGGQKARVALARAVYARTKYVLLDDPLSAVDSHTSRFLLEQLLCGPLLKNRTVILITHHVELVLPAAYYLIRMLDGRIDMQGTVADLRDQGLLEAMRQDASLQTKEDAIANQPAVEPGLDSVEPPTEGRKPRKLVEDEHREVGAIKWSIYKAYLKASSYWTWICLLLLVILLELLGLGEKLWIKVWGEAYGHAGSLHPIGVLDFKSFASAADQTLVNAFPKLQSLHLDDLLGQISSAISWEWPSAQEHPFFYINIFSVVSMSQVMFQTAISAVQFTGGLKASKTLFKKLLVTVVRATMRWHDTTPQGRMLNRFGKDVEKIDSSLAGALETVNGSLVFFLTSTLTVAYFLPGFILPCTILGYTGIYFRLSVEYLNTARDLRRMESNTRSPIFSGFGEILEGIVTVRAFSAEKRFLDDLHRNIDTTTKMWYTYWMTNRWLLFNFQCIGSLATLLTTLFTLSGLVSSGVAGICITSAITFTSSIYWVCRFRTGLELDLNSVERVVEYTNLPQEPYASVQSSPLPAYWPSSSNKDYLVQVEGLVVKYAPELPEILHGISFNLKAKERVGLLGRTGSGKSTLAMSFLRFVEPTSGKIIIDGLDITTIGLQDLRSRLVFIPQDATLFSGSLRENLDPFEEFEDHDCLDVLRRVHLLSQSAYEAQRLSHEPSSASSVQGVERDDTASSTMTSATNGDTNGLITLDTIVSAASTNFSQGQRQLIALARALLRRGSIIILDEATSSIDFDTDAKIQATIREEFSDALLITIAHRLHSVIDYDRLIILDKGELVEFDTPFNLIQKEGGIFRSMCLSSGRFAELEAITKSKSEKAHS